MKQGSDLRGTNISFWYWLNFMLVAIAILAVRLLFDRVHQSFYDIVIASVGSFLYALVIISLYYLRKIMAEKNKPRLY